MAPPPSGPRAPGSRSALIVICLTIFIDLLGFTIIFPLFPALLNHYLAADGDGALLGSLLRLINRMAVAAHATGNYQEVLFGGVLTSAYAFLQFFCSPLWGALSDRIGRRKVLRITIAGTAVSYVLWFFSGSFGLFIFSRLLAGGFAGNLSVATAAVADVTSRENRAKGMAIVGVAFGLGFLFGPALGSIAAMLDLTKHFPSGVSWGLNPFSAAAAIALFFSVVNLIWVSMRFRETLDPEHRDQPSERVRHPFRELISAEAGPARRTNWLYFIFTLAFAGMEFSLSFLAARRFNYSDRDMAKIFIFLGLVLILTQGGIVRRAVPKYGEKAVLLAGMAIVALGMTLVGFASTQGMLYLGLAGLGVGSGLTTPSVSALVSLYSSREKQGRMLGLFRSLGSLARGVGPLIACFVFWWKGPSAPFLIAAAVLIIPWVMALPLPRPVK